MISMDTAGFRKAIKDAAKPLLVMYDSPWCRYCRKLEPAIVRLSCKYADSLQTAQIDINREAELAGQEEIEVVPTLVLYRGGRALGSIVVPESAEQVEDFLRDALEGFTA